MEIAFNPSQPRNHSPTVLFVKRVSVKRLMRFQLHMNPRRIYRKPPRWAAVTITVTFFFRSGHVTLWLSTGEEWVDRNRPQNVFGIWVTVKAVQTVAHINSRASQQQQQDFLGGWIFPRWPRIYTNILWFPADTSLWTCLIQYILKGNTVVTEFNWSMAESLFQENRKRHVTPSPGLCSCFIVCQEPAILLCPSVSMFVLALMKL